MTSPSTAAPAARRQSFNRAVLIGGLALAAVAGTAAAVANHRLAKRSEAANPPRGSFVTVDGVRLHFLEKGSGPALLLLHGNGVSAEDFRASGLLDALAANHRVIAFDRPGFGYSQRPRRRVWSAQAQARLLLRAMSVLGVQRPVVVGHSWGTLVAANLALEAPDQVAGLVLMSGYYRPTLRPDAAVMGSPGVPGVGDVMRFTLSPVAAKLLTPMILKQLFAPAPVSERFADFPISLSRRPSQLRAAGSESLLMGWEAARLSRRLGELTVPVLILGGEADRLIDFSHQSEWLASKLPQARLEGLEGAGHMVHYSRPEAVGEAIARFADETRSAPG